MPTPAKEQSVAELNESFKKAKAAVLANYQGIDATAINTLRSHMRDRSLDFKVIKNKLARKVVTPPPLTGTSGMSGISRIHETSGVSWADWKS